MQKTINKTKLCSNSGASAYINLSSVARVAIAVDEIFVIKHGKNNIYSFHVNESKHPDITTHTNCADISRCITNN